MRKFIILFVAVVSLTCLSQKAYADWENVSTADAFKAAVEADKDIKITADIDLSSLTNESSGLLFNHTFTGKIDGGYTGSNGKTFSHQLMNCRYVFMSGISGATISNIILTNCYFDGWDTESGQLAAEATNSDFINVSLVKCTSKGDRTGFDCDQMGGLIGKATGCNFTNIMALDCELVTDGENAGLIVGKATSCNFNKCFTNYGCNLWADGNDGNAQAGGICGYAMTSSFMNCTNLAMISADDDRIGGIVGYGEGTLVINCSNSGIVCHNSESGYATIKARKATAEWATYTALKIYLPELAIGAVAVYILEQAGRTYVIPELVNTILGVVGGVSSTVLIGVLVAAAATWATCYIIMNNCDPDEAGGIAGCLINATDKKSEAVKCSNYGPVQCDDAYGGGIVGYADGIIIDACLNQAFVSGQEQTGGIVGYANGCTVRSNLCLGNVKAESKRGFIEGEYKNADSNCSGNYFLDRKNEVYSTSRAVTQDKIASGEVTLALNLDIQQRTNKTDSITFRQNLSADSITYPTLNANAGVVTTASTNYSLWKKVKNSGEFLTAITNITAKVELLSDIDLSGSILFSLYSQEYPFSGEIKGNGHTIKNMSYTAMANKYDSDYAVDAALFSYADNAKFRNFTLENFNISQLDQTYKTHRVEAILAANSTKCKYDSINVRNCSILVNSDNDYLMTVGGLIGISTQDTIVNCNVDGTFQAHTYSNDSNLGGITAIANGSVFRLCHSAAILSSDDNRNGGISGYAAGCTFDRCLFTGTVCGKINTAGIVGYAETGTNFTGCVNTGDINGYDKSSYVCHAGIVGYMSDGTNSNCMNFGAINNPSNAECGTIVGNNNNATNEGYSIWYCKYGNTVSSSLSDGTTTWTFDQMKNGAFTYNHSGHYQSIDNIPFSTSWPVPIPAAGTVYSNILCDGTQSYSNIWHNTAIHTQDPDATGICKTCGNIISVPTTINITDAQAMRNFSYGVNKGVDYSSSTITLANDIDMGSIDNFTPIGNINKPFIGTFNGQGHIIKNLSIVRDTQNGGIGLFGWVKGNTTIENVTLDSTCVICTKGYNGVGGIVGVVSNNDTNKTLNILNCGNEASITGDKYVGGILGYNMDLADRYSQVKISNCYNTGDIKATNYATAICGYTTCNLAVTNTWNSGTITGYNSSDATMPFIGYASGAPNVTTSGCFDTFIQNSQAELITADDVKSGYLCFLLNGNKASGGAWGQTLDNANPIPDGNGMQCYRRTMANQWGTICLPFVAALSDDYDLYQLTGVENSTNTIKLEKVSSPTAGEPYIIRRNSDATGISIAAESNTYPVNDPKTGETKNGVALKGTFNQIEITSQDGYIFSGGKFYSIATIKGEKKVYCDPFRAYLAGTASNARELTITIDDATGITETLDSRLRTPDSVKYLENGRVVIIKNNKKYNLSGQEVR